MMLSTITGSTSLAGWWISALLALSGFIAVLCCYKLNKFSSLCYGVIGAVWGWQLFIDNHLDTVSIIRTIAAWFAAPLLAFLLAGILYRLYRKTVIRSTIHYLQLLAYLRPLIILFFALLFVAVCVNNGLIFDIIGSAVVTGSYITYHHFHIPLQNGVLVMAVLFIFLIVGRKIFQTISYWVVRDNIHIESAICMVIASSVILLLFSLPAIETTGLKAAPISVSQLIFASLLGINYTQKRMNVSGRQLLKSIASVFAVSVIAFCCSFLLFSFINKKTPILLQNDQPATAYIFNSSWLIWICFLTMLLPGILFWRKKQHQSGTQAQQKMLVEQKNLFESQKAISALEVKAVVMENESLNNKLELRRQELINVALNISEQKEFLEKIYQEIKSLRKIENAEDKDKKINEIEKMISKKMNFSQEIESFYTQIEKVHKDFNIRLKEQPFNLTENEEKLVTFLRLGFSTKHIASLMNIAPKSVEISRYRLRNKLGLTHEQKLIHFIKSI